jgi:mannosyltransferase
MSEGPARQWGRMFALLAGAGLLAVALVSSMAIERALTGEADGRLQWGPTLFRALAAVHGLLLVFLALRPVRCAEGPVDRSARTTVPWIVLMVLSVVALLLRSWRLNSCLWFDEILTMNQYARLPSLGLVVTTFPDQNQHMLYSILANVSLRLFGESPASLRLPGVVFGVASLWPLYSLTRRLTDARQAILVCLLACVSYHHVWFSQNARGYTGLLFFALWATDQWLSALTNGSRRHWIAYASALSLGAWVHLTMIFVPAAHFLSYLFLLARGGRSAGRRLLSTIAHRRCLLAWLLAGTATLQLYALVLPEFLRSAAHEVSLHSEWLHPLWVLSEALRSLPGGPVGAAGTAAGGLVALVGFVSLCRGSAVAGAAMVLPAVIGGGTLLALGHNLWPRFFFFSMGFGLIVLVHGLFVAADRIARLFSRPDLRGPLGLAATACLTAASAFALPRNYALPKQDFIGAREYVESHRRPDEAVAAAGLAGVAYAEYYAPAWPSMQRADELEALISAAKGVWLVYFSPIYMQSYRPELWKMIQDRFEQVAVFPGTLGAGELYVCRISD